MAESREAQPDDSGEEQEAKLLRKQALEALSMDLAGKREKAIEARASAGIDARWFGDVEAYEGRDEVSRAYAGLRAQVEGYVYQGDQQQRSRSVLVVNVTKKKVDTAAARRADIALPTDDRNWDLRPSTVPALVEQLAQKNVGLTKNGAPVMVTDENGQQRQATMADLANRDIEKASKAALAMRDEIDDQLDMSDAGCGYEGLIRGIIDDVCLLGVGILKGPVITGRTKKVWVPTSDGQGKTIHTLARIQEHKPTSVRVDPWDFYPHPDCGENVKTGQGTWERSRITAADIRKMADIPGYIHDQLKKVLLQGPTKVGEKAPDKPGLQGIVSTDTVFEQWEYHGEISREALLATGNEVPDEDEDVFKTYSGVVIMINDVVVKADIELLDTEELPYDNYVVNKCSGSWVGYSEAFLSRSAQKVITAGWRTMLDNAGQYVGAQIVMTPGLVEPADGVYEVTGMKLWYANKDADVNKVFAVHEIPAHQAEYAAIIKMGMEFLDQETAIPSLAEGNQGQATDVLGGMNLLLNASNVVQRRALKALDDQVTIPHINRYVDWNMQYNPKPEIKGDFEVQARASGALLDQEIQNRGVSQLLQMVFHPELRAGMKKWEAVRRAVRALRFDPKDFVETDDKIAENEKRMAENPPKAPAVEIAEIRALSEAKLESARQAFQAKENELKRQSDLMLAMIDARLTSAGLTSTERQTLEKLKAELAKTSATLNLQKDLAMANHKVSLHQSSQVAKPEAEPPGRAPAGKAFQA